MPFPSYPSQPCQPRFLRRLSKTRSALRTLSLSLLLIPILLQASCATSGPVVTNACTGWEPIYVHTGDVLTDATAKSILAHDEYGAKQCGWIHK
jgi:hypothetical protein